MSAPATGFGIRRPLPPDFLFVLSIYFILPYGWPTLAAVSVYYKYDKATAAHTDHQYFSLIR